MPPSNSLAAQTDPMSCRRRLMGSSRLRGRALARGASHTSPPVPRLVLLRAQVLALAVFGDAVAPAELDAHFSQSIISCPRVPSASARRRLREAAKLSRSLRRCGGRFVSGFRIANDQYRRYGTGLVILRAAPGPPEHAALPVNARDRPQRCARRLAPWLASRSPLSSRITASTAGFLDTFFTLLLSRGSDW